MEPLFDHERLDVYHACRALNREIPPLLQSIPRGNADSKDNLRRAATSISRNIAEGAGRWKVLEKINFYHIARASATECAATLDELVDLRLVDEERIQTPRAVLARILAMLIAMIRSLEQNRDRR